MRQGDSSILSYFIISGPIYHHISGYISLYICHLVIYLIIYLVTSHYICDICSYIWSELIIWWKWRNIAQQCAGVSHTRLILSAHIADHISDHIPGPISDQISDLLSDHIWPNRIKTAPTWLISILSRVFSACDSSHILMIGIMKISK